MIYSIFKKLTEKFYSAETTGGMVVYYIFWREEASADGSLGAQMDYTIVCHS